MSMLAKQTGGIQRECIEADTYQAVCLGVVDLGTQHNDKFNQDQHKVRIFWELPEVRVKGQDKDGRDFNMPRIFSKEYTLSLNEKANLYNDLIAWRGCSFTAEELDGFDLKKIIRANCLLGIGKDSKDGKEYNFISSVAKLMRGLKIRNLENEPVYYDIQEHGRDIDRIPDLMKWVKDIIQKSLEWKAMDNAGRQLAGQDYHADGHDMPEDMGESDIPSDGIPF